MSEQTKMIIDTDIGDDIDDALAIAFALKLRKAEVIGITTVFKNTFLRARLAKKLLAVANRTDIPVIAGLSDGIKTKNSRNEIICQYSEELMKDCYKADNKKDREEEAVDFILDNVRAYGKDLTIVCIGPLTNIARAILKSPETMQNVGRVVIMGGAYYEQFSEWNILCDPEAADILFRSGINIDCVGTDVTTKLCLSDEVYKKLLSYEDDTIKGFLSRLLNLWKKTNWSNPILHDPLAVWFAVSSEYLTVERVLVEIELLGKHSRGMTLNLDNFYRYQKEPLPGFRANVAKDIESDGFIREYLKTVFELDTSKNLDVLSLAYKK